jgi:hypothetical protein
MAYHLLVYGYDLNVLGDNKIATKKTHRLYLFPEMRLEKK